MGLLLSPYEVHTIALACMEDKPQNVLSKGVNNNILTTYFWLCLSP